MGKHESVRRGTVRGIVATAGALAICAAVVVPAAADEAGTVTTIGETGSDDWGRVDPGAECAQSTAWTGRVHKLKVIEKSLYETHATDNGTAEDEDGLVSDAITLPGLGRGSKLFTRSLAGKVPGAAGKPARAVACAAYAEATGSRIEAGLPYLPSPVPGGTQLSPVGIRLDGITTTARVAPGEPIKLKSVALAGNISLAGAVIKKFTLDLPPNFGFRVPSDVTKPVIAQITKDERVTVDAKGLPTRDSAGDYLYDESAPGGYANAVHLSLLGPAVKDLTLGHAAVIGKSTEQRPLCAPGERCANGGR